MQSAFLGCIASAILLTFSGSTIINMYKCKYGIPFSNMLSFASDTCNIMKGVKKGVIAYLREKQAKVITYVHVHTHMHIHVHLRTACQVVNLVVKAAVETLPLKVDELLVDIIIIFTIASNELNC